MKHFKILAAIAVALALAACGGGGGGGTSTPQATPGSTPVVVVTPDTPKPEAPTPGTPDAADTTPPALVSIDPIVNATSVPLGKSMTVVFNEPLDTASVSLALRDVTSGVTSTVPVRISADGKSVFGTTTASLLAYSSVYSGTLSVADIAGNAVKYVTSFTTAKRVIPSMLVVSVADPTLNSGAPITGINPVTYATTNYAIAGVGFNSLAVDPRSGNLRVSAKAAVNQAPVLDLTTGIWSSPYTVTAQASFTGNIACSDNGICVYARGIADGASTGVSDSMLTVMRDNIVLSRVLLDKRAENTVPQGIKISSDGKFAYVNLAGLSGGPVSYVQKVDLSGGTANCTVVSGKGNTDMLLVAGKIWVAKFRDTGAGEGDIITINTDTCVKDATEITLTGSAVSTNASYGLTTDGSKVWVSNQNAHTVVRYNATTLVKEAESSVYGFTPGYLAADDAGNVHVVSQSSDTVYKVNATTLVLTSDSRGFTLTSGPGRIFFVQQR